MAKQPKFKIGDIVFSKVQKRGTYGPSLCLTNMKLRVDEIEQSENGCIYACGYEGWQFSEDELISKNEYMKKLQKM